MGFLGIPVTRFLQDSQLTVEICFAVEAMVDLADRGRLLLPFHLFSFQFESLEHRIARTLCEVLFTQGDDLGVVACFEQLAALLVLLLGVIILLADLLIERLILCIGSAGSSALRMA